MRCAKSLGNFLQIAQTASHLSKRFAHSSSYRITLHEIGWDRMGWDRIGEGRIGEKRRCRIGQIKVQWIGKGKIAQDKIE